MPTALQLVNGTQKVIKTSFKNSNQSGLKMSQINMVSMKGVKVKHLTATIDSATDKSKKYKVWFMFTNIEDPGKTEPSVARDKVYVRCGCDGFYFYFSWANKKHKALAGTTMRPYVRKTPPPPLGLPYKNPKEIPGCCKHLIFAIGEFVKITIFK
jgi:hypothetical protein